MRINDIAEDLDHSRQLLFHSTRILAASLILATGVIEAKTDDKAYAAKTGNGVSLTRSYEYALRHKGLQLNKIIFVLEGLDTHPVDYWANKTGHRTEAEEWHDGPIRLRTHLISINCPRLSFAEFLGKVGENLTHASDEEKHYLYRGEFNTVQAWWKFGYKQDYSLWNRWKPVRGLA